ncbi:MAG: response regulator [Bacteroidota bacterium]
MDGTLILDIIQSLGVVATGVLGLYMKYRVKKSDTLVVDKIDNVHFEVKAVRKEQTKNGKREVCVLVLDDNADDLEAIGKIIKRTGKGYDLFSNEDLYLAHFTNEINVHIIDHFLQKKSGLDILREVKERNEDNFVIAYTGSQDEKTIIEYLNAGVSKFVDKNNPDHLRQLEKYLTYGIEKLSNK